MQHALDDQAIAQSHLPKVATPIFEQELQLEKNAFGEKSADASSINVGETDHYPDKPTDEELHSLHRVSGTIPWSAYTIAFVELCERFGWYGTTVVCECIQRLLFLSQKLTRTLQSPTSSNVLFLQDPQPAVSTLAMISLVLLEWASALPLVLPSSTNSGLTSCHCLAHTSPMSTLVVSTPS